MADPFSLQNRPEAEDRLQKEQDLPPIVARMVVEIRSDGSRTIARGALEDRQTGESVALHVDAPTPLALVKELSKAMLKTPVLAKEAVRGLLPQFLQKKR